MVSSKNIFSGFTMSTRNRADGWRHAKLSGHSNEKIIADKINSDRAFRERLERRIGNSAKIVQAKEGGLNEAWVADVFGGSTKSKADLELVWSDDSKSQVSIKKSKSGQVYLIGVDRFIDGFEHHFGKKIDKRVQRGIRLFFGGDPELPDLLNSASLCGGLDEKIRSYQKRKGRMVWVTLAKYDKAMANDLLQWVRANIGQIFLYSFQRGLASSEENWAQYLWYHNEIESGIEDKLFDVEQVASRLARPAVADQIYVGSQTGGTTIQLPFGFLQWHQAKLQFHHNQGAISLNAPST